MTPIKNPPDPDPAAQNPGRQTPEPFVSVFNDVLGPIMRGPSSSHTAGSYHIARTVRDLLGRAPHRVDIIFDIDGSYAQTFVQQGVDQAFATELIEQCRSHDKICAIRCVNPVYRVQRGNAPFLSAAAMAAWAGTHHCSLGETVLRYESTVLGISEKEALNEMHRRYQIMKQSVADGFGDEKVDMLLLEPSAGKIQGSIEGKRVPVGGIHAKAAAAALAVMHTCNSRGVVCAAPTGGAAGTLPGTLTALEEAFQIDRRRLALMLFAAGGVGLILAMRGTFAAEVAGCQVEIGAAGAMASAAVVEFAGGNADQACDAAAISFQNTMGSVCDLVQGICELPCHTRNAAAASSAFTNADLVLGGYQNPVPLDDTIDAVMACGRLLPSELRCTSRGGLAQAPSAKGLVKRR